MISFEIIGLFLKVWILKETTNDHTKSGIKIEDEIFKEFESLSFNSAL
jgi:hypothetical protein